jgi:hypothetical protein
MQGAYYLATGMLPWVSMRAFEAITGKKTDDWLVQTVGAIVVAIAVALWAGALRSRISIETVVLAIASGSAFVLVDVYFVMNKTIGPIYLADAALQAVIIIALLVSRRVPER